MNAMNANQSRFHSTGNDGLLNVFIMSMLPVNASPPMRTTLGSYDSNRDERLTILLTLTIISLDIVSYSAYCFIS